MVLGFVLSQLQSNFRNRGKVDPVSLIIQRSINSMASPITSVTISWNNFLAGVFRAGALERENSRLKLALRSSEALSARIQQLQFDLDRIQKLQGLTNFPGRTAVAARVTGLFVYDNRITLNIGSASGVKPDMPVISGDGLVGVIQTVTTNESQALLITSPSIHIGAIADRNPPPAGLLKGENMHTLIVDFLDPNAPVAIGDEVVTSGFSTLIPRGIPIGRVFNIQNNPDFGSRRAYVYPWLNVGSLSVVKVLE